MSNDIWASDLHLTPNGRFLYAAERTSSTINAFSVDAANGTLSYLGSTPTEKQPRGFRIDPTGRFMVVSGEKSETLSTYAIDAASGALSPVGRYPTGKGSNWVEIVSFDPPGGAGRADLSSVSLLVGGSARGASPPAPFCRFSAATNLAASSSDWGAGTSPMPSISRWELRRASPRA